MEDRAAVVPKFLGLGGCDDGRAGDSGGGLSREFNLSYCHVASRPSAHDLIINCTCQASLSPL